MLRAAVTAAVLVYNAWEHFLLPPHTARMCICLSGAGTGALELYLSAMALSLTRVPLA